MTDTNKPTRACDDAFLELVREKVLAALDASARKRYGVHNIGWKDSELPELFKVIDKQAERIAQRAAAQEA